MCLNALAGQLFGNQFFQRREVVAGAQYQAAQDFGRRGFIGKEFEQHIGAVVNRLGMEHMLGAVFFQQAGGADVLNKDS